MAEIWKYFAHEDDYADLDTEAVCARLGAALAIPTVDGPTPEQTNWQAFDALLAHFTASYPHVFDAATLERVDHSLLFTIPGSDSTLDPVMIMGHMDVVPVVAGTEKDWTYDAFSGQVDDEYIWGRGALDMKDHVVAALEATEYVLAHGLQPRRSLLLAFGQDEETYQSGARRLGKLLKERGTHVSFLVDEGDYGIVDLGMYGAPGHHGIRVNLAEKGYADVKLTVRSAGGHSSNPFGGTSLAILARAIDRIARDSWPLELVELDRQLLCRIAPYITTEPLASWVKPLPGEDARAAIDRNAQAIAQWFAQQPDLYPLVVTTVAPTMIEGGSAQANVMPQDMTATINVRLLPGASCEQLFSRVKELVTDLPVEVEPVWGVSNDPSAISRADGDGFAALERIAARYFVEPETGEPLTLLPALVVGASDARMYEDVCDQCLRFSAFVADANEVARGVHGTNERITKRAYVQGVRFFIRLLEESLR